MDQRNKNQSQNNSSFRVPQGDPKAGKAVFDKYCQVCHSMEANSSMKVGPPLQGLINSTAGQRTNYAYSKAMKQCEIVWNQQNLYFFIWNPVVYIPGNRMGFAGLKSQKDRANLVAYLKQN